ncbi:MAG: class I SAM-dependent methyltransferase [Acidimicrobiales bacterium]|nr:class I SAM-dependent methyltransferase [Acidimicrobiales bacterium]
MRINRTMDRDDLLTVDGRAFVDELDRLNRRLERDRLPVTSWYGRLPNYSAKAALRRRAKKLLGRAAPHEEVAGWDNRGGVRYEAVPGIETDDLHPWFLYWEAYWVMTHGPSLTGAERVLDAGGTASLFSAYLASIGPEVHSVDLNPVLVEAGEELANRTGWNLHSYAMDMTNLDFPDEHFDHAYSICVFEHLDAGLRHRALNEIARVLKPGGILSITFDYRGKGVFLAGSGFNDEPANLLQTPDDVYRHFGSCESLTMMGDGSFHDNGKSYLTPIGDTEPAYTFGGLFLQKH